MKNKILIWTFAFLVLLGIVLAIPPNPEVYWGFVYVEGELAPNGSVLSVETAAGELLANGTLPLDSIYPGSYYFEIPFDDLHTQDDEGAVDGEALNWRLDGVSALEPRSDTAEIAKTNSNFSIYGILNPVLTAELSSSNNSVMLGENISVFVVLNNSGDGTANVSLTGTNLTDDLPKNLQVPKKNTTQTNISLTPDRCGEFSPDLTISCYNLAGDLLETFTQEINFSVQGSDIEITNVTSSNYSIMNGSDVTITAMVSNKGDYSIDGFDIVFYENLNDTPLHTIYTNLTLKSGENATVSFNWEPELGEHTITSAVNITEQECDNSNNELESPEIVVELPEEKTSSSGSSSSGGGGGGSSGGGSSYTPLIESNQTVNQTINLTIEEPENQTVLEINETENSTSSSMLTGMVTKISNYEYKKFLPYFIVIIGAIVLVISLGYWHYVDRPEAKKKKKTEDKQKEPAKKPELKPVPHIKKPFNSKFNIPLKKKPETKTHLHIKKSLNPGIKVKLPFSKRPEDKIKEKIDLLQKQAKKEPPKEIKPKISSSKDAVIKNFGSRIGLFKRKEKEDFHVPLEQPKPHSSFVPYHYLDMAIELVEKITENKQPRDALIRKYGGRYPKFLIEMAGKYVFLNMGFDKKIDVIAELHKLQVLDKDYKYISAAKLEKSIDIVAKGHAMKK